NLGVQVSSVASYHEWSTATREVLRTRPNGLELISQMRPPPATQEMGYFVAVGDRSRAVALNGVCPFARGAGLVWSFSAPDHPAASSSRYLLHTFMRSDLRRRGVRYLVGGTGVRDAPGLHYYQHLLGYEVRNLRIRVGETPKALPAFVSNPCADA